MLSFKDFLIAEAEGEDHEELVRRATEDKVVNLTTEVRRIMQNLDLAQDPNPEDPHSYTVFDLFLALDVVKSAVENRLVGSPDEHQNDPNNGYDRLWTSIEDETKDAVKTLFQFQSNDKTRYPRFTHDFNKLVVSRIMKALRLMEPNRARSMVGTIVDLAKNAVNNNLVQYSDVSRGEAQNRMRKYTQAVAKQLGSKQTSNLSRVDRLKVIQDVARRIHSEQSEDQQ